MSTSAAQYRATKKWRAKFKARTGVDYGTLVYRMTRKVNYPPAECDVCGKWFKPIRKTSRCCSVYCYGVDERLKRKGLE